MEEDGRDGRGWKRWKRLEEIKRMDHDGIGRRRAKKHDRG